MSSGYELAMKSGELLCFLSLSVFISHAGIPESLSYVLESIKFGSIYILYASAGTAKGAHSTTYQNKYWTLALKAFFCLFSFSLALLSFYQV